MIACIICTYINAFNGYGKIAFSCNFGPTQFKAVRKAIAYCLDRVEFCNLYSGGYAVVVNSYYGQAGFEFRNALIPIITIVTSWFIGIFGGSVVIERLFLWNGMGKIMIDSLMRQDYMIVLAMQMFYVIIALAGNLIMDIAYTIADPRVKLR